MAQSYDQRPEMALEADKRYIATLELEQGGEIVIDLHPEEAPETVNSFVFLAGEGYYDGVTFHRVIAGFMAQGGDPTGSGSGGPGYTVPDEINDHKHVEGVISMAKTAAPDSAGSQFFITLADVPHLDGTYTVFGKVSAGMDAVHSIPLRDPEAAREPGVAIKTITIEVR